MRYLYTTLLLFLSFQMVGQVWNYDCPGGETFRSPDYEVSIIQGEDTLENFVYYTFKKDTNIRYSWGLEPEDIFITEDKGFLRSSMSIFSFNDPVTVRVKILDNAKYISLPLKSAKILPSSYNIPCAVKEGNIIEFKLDRPEKVIVFPNYEEAWDVYAQRGIGHVPIDSWTDNYQVEKNRSTYNGTQLESALSEGYRNPLFLFAHAPEKRVPDPGAPNTLVIHPGDTVNQGLLANYDTVWFRPGVHTLSHLGESPWFQTYIEKGQTFYLEGGAYVKARFKGNTNGEGKTSIVGRGIISGIDLKWVANFAEGSQVITVDSVVGVTITDRACFGMYGGSYIGDVAMVGGWHGNTDGPDYVDNCLIENCFLQAHDDNLKINHNTHARHCVIWQGSNAHAIMVKETFRDGMTFENSVVEDIDIVAYLPGTDWDNPWPQISRAAISCVTAMDLKIINFTFDNIRIEAPYVSRVMNVYNLNTNKINPGWFKSTSANYHTRINGITYSNITVNTPVIGYNALLGSGYDDALKNLRLYNMNINGVVITPENIDEYFEIEYEKIEHLEISTDTIVPGRGPFKDKPFRFPGDTVMAWQYDYYKALDSFLFETDSGNTIGIYGCNDTLGFNIRAYQDASAFSDAAQFKWDTLSQTFSKNGQWVEYTVQFDTNAQYQLLVRGRGVTEASFKFTVFDSMRDIVFSRDVTINEDFINLGDANEQTNWLLSNFGLTEMYGQYILRFDWYDHLGEEGIFGGFSFIKSSLDFTPPEWVYVSTGEITIGEEIRVMTSEKATVYLVPAGTASDIDIIRTLAIGQTEVEANIWGKINSSGLDPGDYVVYACDKADNISGASTIITLQFPLKSPTLKSNSSVDIKSDHKNGFIIIESQHRLKCTELYTISGRKVIQENHQSKDACLATRGFNPGIYILRVQDITGSVTHKKVWVDSLK